MCALQWPPVELPVLELERWVLFVRHVDQVAEAEEVCIYTGTSRYKRGGSGPTQIQNPNEAI